MLGSLLGGVQLFAMIKMLGLQLVDIEKQYSNRPDLNQQQNIWAAYQVLKNADNEKNFVKNKIALYNNL